MTDLTTVENIEAFLQIEITSAAALASAQFAIKSASAAIRNYTRQQITLVEDDEVVMNSPDGQLLFLPELPVVSVDSVIENDEELEVTTDYKLRYPGIIRRVGRPWLCGDSSIEVVYTHGYATIPDDIVDVATRAASRAYQSGLRSADTDGVLGVVSKSLGDFAVAYGSESGGGVGEGILGASAAFPLLASEKRLLDKYRLKGI